MSDRLLLSVSGARGIVGKTIDEDVVGRLTLAFCASLPEGPIAVGRDTRPSGESFLRTAVEAVTGTGRDAIDLGVATTPTVELVTERSAAVGGLIVTASHNPVQWNALKFLDHRGIFITKDVSEKLYAAFKSGDAEGRASKKHRGTVIDYATAAQDHIDAILALDVIDTATIRARKFKVVLDCINGAGSVIAPRLLRALGVVVVEIDCTPDGDFHRDPEPRPENLVDLAARVESEQADLGLACDPDADRLALVADGGEAISEEYTLALAADLVLAKEKGPLVVNLSTSRVVDHVAAAHGAKVERTPVGEAHVVDRMLKERAVIGGEGNGGVIYPALHPGRDAMLGMALVLQLLAERGVTLSEQLLRYPPFVITKEKVALGGVFAPDRISADIRRMNPVTIDTQDGVKATFADGWIHLRVSNTEGVVRVITEAATAERAAALERAGRDALERSWASGERHRGKSDGRPR